MLQMQRKGERGLRVRRNKTIYALTMTAAVVAAMCVLSPWAVPLGPVPMSLGTLLIYLCAWMLSPGRAAAAAAVYVLIGAAGLPVFSGFLGGLGHLAGPTGGYIVGYIPLAFLCSVFANRFVLERKMCAVGMVLGTGVLYAVGTAWFCIQTGTPIAGGLAVCVLPFLPGDFIKMLGALILGPVLRRRLERAGLLYK